MKADRFNSIKDNIASWGEEDLNKVKERLKEMDAQGKELDKSRRKLRKQIRQFDKEGDPEKLKGVNR